MFQYSLDTKFTKLRLLNLSFLAKLKFIFSKKSAQVHFIILHLQKKFPNLDIKITLILTDRLFQLGIQNTQHDWISQQTIINVVKACIQETSMYLFLYSILKLWHLIF